jgi:chromosomal replication initiator protein
MMDRHWQACALRLEQELTPQLYKTWIKPLICLGYDDGEHLLRLGAPNRFKLDWIRNQFGSRICELACAEIHPKVRVQFEVQPNSSPANAPVRSASYSGPVRVDPGASVGAPTNLAPQIDSIGQLDATEESAGRLAFMPGLVEREVAPHVERSKLNLELTFDTFVTGKANQMARAAALQVAQRPGVSYNPLFLYGGVGLGKTHLIHAVGNALLEANPGARIRYIHAEQYVSDVVKAYQRKAFDELKRYYHSLDLLLIDDIQFFAGKQRTQEEFFYTFEALVAARRQILITSDTYPKELSGIDERLVSRFDYGLTVAIEPPELEMRVAILLRKAESSRVDLSEEVAFFIAKNLRQNVRELEGALRKVIAYSSFHNQPITLELVKLALRELLSVNRGQISVELIQKTVADYYKIKVADMGSKRRPANIALPRQVAMYLAKELTQKSLPDIGELFGGRDHTTVLHAVRKITNERKNNTELNHALHVLEQTLRA